MSKYSKLLYVEYYNSLSLSNVQLTIVLRSGAYGLMISRVLQFCCQETNRCKLRTERTRTSGGRLLTRLDDGRLTRNVYRVSRKLPMSQKKLSFEGPAVHLSSN